MITFEEIEKMEIYSHHNNHYHDDARYFSMMKDNNFLCICGIISRNKEIAEAFWILDSFSKKTLSKTFFHYLFNHLFSLGYKEIYTWTRCKKLINIFGHFSNFGIEEVHPPKWDNDDTKTWFMKRI